MGSVKIESETSVKSFVLPVDGEIILDGSITLGADNNEGDCKEKNVYYMEKSISSWAQPDVWSSSKFNKATPDAEKIPCFDDVVEFPENIQSTILLPDLTQYVSDIRIGKQHFDTKKLLDHIRAESDESLQFVLNTFLDTGVVVENKQCQSRSGCPCQKNVLKIDCSSKYCPVPTCIDPIKPIGHCCKICGGFISFDVDESFDIMEFKELVESTVDNYGRNRLDYHVGRLPPNKVQLLVVDKKEYEGTSAQVVNTIDYNMQKHWVQSAKLSKISGTPLYKYGMGGKIFVSMFFVVVFTIGAIYAYYYKLPEIRYPIMGRSFTSMFSRIQRRTDSVVSLTRRDSTITTSGVRTAFRNPLYDSRRGRVQVEELVTPQ
ncbi:unnamed protein product [Parnassius apollo]|uniref:Protein amnionless n=1 Tax=Parnassius apollo TaxID=110799 RepID=A0A8S3WMH8_PARAO|nr:unnamed protein product [Parnassius apollo]